MDIKEFIKKFGINDAKFNSFKTTTYKETDTPVSFMLLSKKIQNSEDENALKQDHIFMSAGLAEDFIENGASAIATCEVIYNDAFHGYGLRRNSNGITICTLSDVLGF